MKKRCFSFILALCMICTLLPVSAIAAGASLDNFQKTLTYTPGQYADVPATNTFSENVKAGYEYGIMQGYGTTFGVSNNITRLASIIIACRLNCIYNTGANNITELYTGTTQEIYLQYAQDHGILCEFDDVSKNATRAEFAAILSSALPDEALPEINTVEMYTIPDVTPNTVYSDAIYRLYRTGIINGSDKMGTFYPESYITRGAACAIATRMCDESLRKNVDIFAAGTEEVWIYIPDLPTKSLSINKATKITCYLLDRSAEGSDNLLYSSENTSIITNKWMDSWVWVAWKDTTIPTIELEILPRNNGSTTFSISTNQHPEVCLTIPVTVSGYTPQAPDVDTKIGMISDLKLCSADLGSAIFRVKEVNACYISGMDNRGVSCASAIRSFMALTLVNLKKIYNTCKQYPDLSQTTDKINRAIKLLEGAMFSEASIKTTNYYTIIMNIYNANILQDADALVDSAVKDLQA